MILLIEVTSSDPKHIEMLEEAINDEKTDLAYDINVNMRRVLLPYIPELERKALGVELLVGGRAASPAL